MAAKEVQYIVTKKPSGHYTIDVYVPKGNTSDLAFTGGAAKSSPVGQCLRLFERLFNLNERITTGKNYSDA